MTATNTSAWSIAFAGVAHTFTVLSAEVSLDDRSSIYCEATVTLAPESEAVLATVNPLVYSLRATLTADQTSSVLGHQVRTFDLYVHRRTVNADETVTFYLASDEIIADLRGLVSDLSTDYYTHGSVQTVRQLVNDVLAAYIPGPPGAITSGANATIPRTHAMRNGLTNPSFEVSAAEWAVNSNVTAGPVRVAIPAGVGSIDGGAWCLRWTAGAGSSSIRTDPFPMKGGDLHYALAGHVSNVSRNLELRLQYYSDAAGTVQIGTALNGGYASLTNQFTYHDANGIAPPGTASVRLVMVATGNAAGNLHYIDNCSLVIWDHDIYRDSYPGGVSAPWEFEGYSAAVHGAYNPYPALYTVAWEGAAHASASVMKPIADQGFWLTLMRPGQSVSEFLRPAVQLTGGRLFCDESRVWRLVASTYTLAGTITAQEAVNLTDAGDDVDIASSEDGVPLTFTGVVIDYTFTGADGITLTKRDYAGNGSGRVYHLKLDTAYPGSGAAAAMLARAAGRGRTKPFSALADYTASPGKALALTHRGVNYTGRLSQVTFRWSLDSDSDRMTIVPKELV